MELDKKASVRTHRAGQGEGGGGHLPYCPHR